jgi:hypothetical protein
VLLVAGADGMLACSGGGGSGAEVSDAQANDHTTSGDAVPALGDGSDVTTLGDVGDAGNGSSDAGGDTAVDSSTSPDDAGGSADATDAANTNPCAPTGTGATGVLGCPCSPTAALACAGNAQKVSILCNGGVWTYASSCMQGQNCDTTPGANQGTCGTIDALCADSGPASTVCKSTTVVTKCGPDLLTDTPVQTCTLPACVGGACTNVCIPGQSRCVSDRLYETCTSPLGQWTDASTCGYACLTTDAGGYCGGSCVPEAGCGAACSNGQQTPGTCDSTGTCIAGSGALQPCAPFVCGPTACKTYCLQRSDCADSTKLCARGCTNVATLAAGSHHACALMQNGALQCWGDGTGGDLANGNTYQYDVPQYQTVLDGGITTISAGDTHTCAVTSSEGGLECWGANGNGQVTGSGTFNVTYPTPQRIAQYTGDTFTHVASRDDFNCAIDTSGRVFCWGYGYAGNDAGFYSGSYAYVGGLPSNALAVAPGFPVACVLLTGGSVWCWGSNQYGAAVGNNDSGVDALLPAPVAGLSSGVTSLSLGGTHACAVTSGGGVMCWGSDTAGELGDGTNNYAPTPVPVSGLSSGVVSVAAGDYHTCALTTAGAVMCWGSNSNGELGNNKATGNSSTPVAVSGLSSGVASIVSGGAFSCAVLTAGGMMCWGANYYGQLGDGTGTDQATPVAVREP